LPGPGARRVGADTLVHNPDSSFDASAFEQSLVRREPRRWIGWRLRLLVLAALLGCVAVFAVMHVVAGSAHLDASWQPDARAAALLSSPIDELGALAGRTLATVSAPGQAPVRLDESALQRTARWLVDDARRVRWLQLQEQLAQALSTGRVTLRFTDGSQLDVATPARGYAGLGLLFWPLTGLALLLYLVGVGVLLLRPNARNALYTLMAWCQAANLLLIAAEPSRGLGQPAGFGALDLLLRMGLTW
jgi:hypothetical protein